MRTVSTAFLTILTFSFALSGCDSYNLLDQFRRSVAVELAVQQSSLEQGETTTLYPSGGTPPYSFAVIADNIYASGTYGSVTGEVYTAGTAIGTVTIHLVDSAGATTNATIMLIPPAPTISSVTSSGSPPKNTVTWASYGSTSKIGGFVIQRSTDGLTFADQGTSGSTATSYLDATNVQPGKTYYYRVLAVNGPMRSRASSILAVST
jgi:hypothetical protein